MLELTDIIGQSKEEKKEKLELTAQWLIQEGIDPYNVQIVYQSPLNKANHHPVKQSDLQ